MAKDKRQGSLDLTRVETLEFTHSLYYQHEKTSIGVLSHLALEAGDWVFNAVSVKNDLYEVTNELGVRFLAKLQDGKGSRKGTYEIKGCVERAEKANVSFFDKVNINGVGTNGGSVAKFYLFSGNIFLSRRLVF